jgi:hypothetical protein
VLAVLCGEPGAPELPPLELANLPADEAEHGTVELREIRNLENVNRLAGEQALRFGPGLNVVVERQALPIRVPKLHGVRWTPELAEEIDVAMREVSGGAHQEPLGREAPSLTRLEALLDKFEALCERTKPGSKRGGSAEGTAQAPVPLRSR